MKKRIVGTYESEKQVAEAVEKLQLEGHRPEEILLIGEEGEKTNWLREETAAKVETPAEETEKEEEEKLSFLDKVKMAFKGQTEFTGSDTYGQSDPLDFKAHGFSEKEAAEYEQAVKDGKLVVMAPELTSAADKGIQDETPGEHENEAGEELADNELADPLRPAQTEETSDKKETSASGEDPVREEEKNNTADPEGDGPSQIGDPMSPEDPKEQATEAPKFPRDTDVDPDERDRHKDRKPSDDQ